MKSLSFIFIRLTCYLIFGILFYFYFRPEKLSIIILGITALAVFLVAFSRSRKLIFNDSIFGITTFLLVAVIGIVSAYLSVPENNPTHFSHQQINTTAIAEAEILEQLKPTKKHERYLAEIRTIKNEQSIENSKGKILINIPKEANLKLLPGIHVLIPAQFETFSIPKNPYAFDYAKYMQNQKVSAQSYLSKPEIFQLKKQSFSFKEIRAKIIGNLDRSGMNSNELGILKALVLGEKSEIDNNLYKSYAAAGAVHILAISGLHIGILLLFLNFLFKPMERVKRGPLIKLILIILILWLFAFLTGLSPSVVRAVTMFSFIAVGLQVRKKSSVLNSVFLSLFFLLLINPYYLFQVGFQMSYLPVTGIILLQPKLERLLNFHLKIATYLWKLITVSFAAQIAVLPLSLFYFHQFPGLFLLTNIFVLPLLSFILIYGFIVILLATLNILPTFLAHGLGLLLNFMNTLVLKISSFSSFVIENINFSLLQMLSSYLLLSLITVLIYRQKSYLIFGVLASILLFQLATLEKHLLKPRNELVIFQEFRSKPILLRKGSDLHYFGKDSNSPNIQHYRTNNFTDKLYQNDSVSVFRFCEQNFLIVDSSFKYFPSEINFQNIVLENSPKVNLQRLIDETHPEMIIATANNYSSFQKLWKKTALKQKIPFHSIDEKGAYILNCE